MNKNSEKKNIRFGVLLSYVSMVASFFGTLLFTNRILNYVGDYNYGLYTFVGSVTSWLTVASSALNASFLRFTSIEAKQSDGRTDVTNGLYLKLFAYLGVLILLIGAVVIGALSFRGVLIGQYSWEDSRLMYIMFAASIANISVTTAFTVYRLYINYKSRFIYEKSVAIAVSLLHYVGHFLIAFFTRSVLLIAFYTLLISILNIIANMIYAKKSCGIQFRNVALRDHTVLIRQIGAFSGILILNSVIDQVNSNLDKTFLGIFARPEDITIYQMGMQFNSYLIIMVVAISSVFAPTINRLIVSGEKEKVDALFLRISRIQSIVVTCISFGFVACGKEFIVSWLGEARSKAYYVGSILMLLNIMPLAVKTSVDIQRAMNKHYFRSFLYFGVAILNMALSVIFLKTFPARYAVYACLLGTVIASIITQWTAMNIYNYKVIRLPIPQMLKRLAMSCGYGILSATGTSLVKQNILLQMPASYFKVLLEMTVFLSIFAILLLIFERKFLLSLIRGARG